MKIVCGKIPCHDGRMTTIRGLAADVFEDAPRAAGEPEAVRASVGEDAPARAAKVPESLDGPARRLWIIRERLDATRNALAQADAEQNLTRIAPLTKQLVELLEQEERLAPPAPADADAEERRWRGQADAVMAKILAGIRETKAA